MIESTFPLKSEVILDCNERRCLHLVILTQEALYWRLQAIWRLFVFARECRRIPISKLEAKIVRRGVLWPEYGISVWSSTNPEDAFYFNPRNPLPWIDSLASLGVNVIDEFDTPGRVVAVFLCNYLGVWPGMAAIVVFIFCFFVLKLAG